MVAVKYLLDTNALSEPVRPQPDSGLMQRLAANQHRVTTASIVIHEMTYGLERLPPSKKRRRIEEFISGLLDSDLPILPYDTQAAKWHGRERARLESLGKKPPFRDSQIAAIAKVRSLVLVTANLVDFEHMAGIELEDWKEG